MRYRLRTLLIVAAIGPPMLAVLYWIGVWVWLHPLLVIGVTFVLGYLSLWIIGPLMWFTSIVDTICGPSPAKPSRPKKRRVYHVRLGRYADGST